ncbi:MAG: hypothetical protein WCO00_08895 [Rhodospirillaceae bacterium]
MIDFNRKPERTRLDFGRINAKALARFPDLLARWLPGGKRVGNEWIALNPRRTDTKPGSFSVNMATGKWSDFASGDRGGDPISLAAYLDGSKQGEAARKLSDMLGVR